MGGRQVVEEPERGRAGAGDQDPLPGDAGGWETTGDVQKLGPWRLGSAVNAMNAVAA